MNRLPALRQPRTRPTRRHAFYRTGIQQRSRSLDPRIQNIERTRARGCCLNRCPFYLTRTSHATRPKTRTRSDMPGSHTVATGPLSFARQSPCVFSFVVVVADGLAHRFCTARLDQLLGRQAIARLVRPGQILDIAYTGARLTHCPTNSNQLLSICSQYRARVSSLRQVRTFWRDERKARSSSSGREDVCNFQSSQGLMTGTPAASNPAVSRVATPNPAASAVAAI